MSKVIYPITNLSNIEQIIFHRGKGVYLYDEAGKAHLDAMSGLWCTSLGYGNEELAETAKQQTLDLSYAHLFGGKSHPVAIALAEKLSDMVPIDDAYVFFGMSGSDANDSHIKFLRYYFNAIGKPQKRKIIARERGYHGLTYATSALSGIPVNRTSFDVPTDAVGVIRTASNHYYHQGLEGESEQAFTSRLMHDLEQQILKENPDTIAAFIAEPICGAGGVIVPPKGYFDQLQNLLEKYDIFLIDDEVICGFGRTGNDFGATTYGMKPQMMSLAKALSSGYAPLSAAVISGAIYKEFVGPSESLGVFGHGYTYTGHPVACAIALKTLEICDRESLYEYAGTMGHYLQKRLREFSNHVLVGEVRGEGMIAALELVANKKTKQGFNDGSAGLYCQQHAQDSGLIIRAVAGNSLAICPPLIITKEQVDELISKLAMALDATARKFLV